MGVVVLWAMIILASPFILLFVFAIVLSRMLPGTRTDKNKATLSIIVLTIVLVSMLVLQNMAERNEKKRRQSLYQERCETAGETIYKTAENVDSFLDSTNLSEYLLSSYRYIDHYRYKDRFDRNGTRYRSTRSIKIYNGGGFRYDTKEAPAPDPNTFRFKIGFQNTGTLPAKVMFARETITSEDGRVTHSQGPGHHIIPAGETTEYLATDQIDLNTPTGSLRGTYTMLTEEGFCEVELPEIQLK